MLRTFSAFLLIAVFSLKAADLRLNLNHSGASASVQMQGDNEVEYLLESITNSVSTETWKALGAVYMTDGAFVWNAKGASNGSRFFRARAIEPSFAENFRLIDHTGKSRELYYHSRDTNLAAIVLTFAQSNYTGFATQIARLKTNDLYKSKVLFWTIDADAANSRTNIARVAAAGGIDFPIFHDPLQLVARDFGANFNGETFCITRHDLKIVYRGVIEDEAGRNYVAEALDKALAYEPVTITRVEPDVAPITRVTRAVADYSTVIAPLLQRKCVTCHSPGNVGPFAMTNYAAVVEHSPHMKEMVMEKMMPPWHADPLYGKFSDDGSLSDLETTQLIDWISAGTPRGAGPDPLTNIPPPPPKWPVELGEPDQIVTIPIQSVPATGTIAYRYIFANSTNTTPKYLRAAVVRPSNPAVVHHYIVWQGHSQFAMLTGIATYVPGHNDRPYADGTGIQIPANSPLTFNLHYTANGKATTDKPELGLYYSDTPPVRALKMAAPLNLLFPKIPAFAPEAEYTASQSFPAGTKIYSFSPHMHTRGLRMRFDLITGTTRTTLASIPKYDFMWQTIYTLETPFIMPANSRIEVVGAFDNSRMNPFNPDPSISMGWGEQSWEEMFIGYMEYSDP